MRRWLLNTLEKGLRDLGWFTKLARLLHLSENDPRQLVCNCHLSYTRVRIENDDGNSFAVDVLLNGRERKR
jgi:hypothetical protein